MKRTTLAAFALIAITLIGCDKETQYPYDSRLDFSSVNEYCTQDNLDKYGSDVCIPQQLNDDGTIKAQR